MYHGDQGISGIVVNEEVKKQGGMTNRAVDSWTVDQRKKALRFEEFFYMSLDSYFKLE
jgi:hypothetical protein